MLFGGRLTIARGKPMTTWQSLGLQLLVGTYTQDTESQGIYLVTEEGDLICQGQHFQDEEINQADQGRCHSDQ